MDKQAFLSLLRERLIKFEVDEENINKYSKQFERYFNTMTDDEINDQIVNYDGVEGIAQNIIKLIRKKQDSPQTISSVSKGTNTQTITYPVIQLKAEKSADSVTCEIETVKSDSSLKNNQTEDKINPITETDGESKSINGSDTADERSNGNIEDNLQPEDDYYNLKKKNSNGFSPAILSENIKAEYKTKKINSASQRIPSIQENKTTIQNKSASGHSKHIDTQKQTQLSQIKQSEYKQVSIERKSSNINKLTDDNLNIRQTKTINVPNIDFNELDETFLEDTVIPNTALYWIVIILTIPLSVPLFLTVLFLFIAAFSILAVSIVFLVTGLIFLIVAGTGLSLVGIIYGVTQIFKSLPIGLFEIGFGVIIGGTAMLLGILVYNTAIRFLPFVIKYLIVFFMFTISKIKDLFKFIKRECAKQ
ncbi:MAG: hypothetical protein ACYCWE_13155 [Eubacteriales bacterium]